jgi:hypothetical protein
VLYNGKGPYPDEKELKLSESFYDPGELGGRGKGIVSLELRVKVYNINHGHNGGITGRCKTLEGYSIFVGKVRGYEVEGKSREEGMKLAVKECIEEGVLKEFLERNGREVMDMLLTEWNWEDALAVREEEGREEGMEKGQNMVLELVKQGYSVEQIEAKLAAIKSDRTETAGK